MEHGTSVLKAGQRGEVRAHVGTLSESRTPRAHVGTAGQPPPGPDGPLWREIDVNLRRIAASRGALDAEELRWLALADRLEVHRQFACASMLEYVERVLGYGPRVAKERLRVARALESLPALAASLGKSELSYSAVRELSRVARPWNEQAWIERARNKTLREVEQCVAGRLPGDDPDDPQRPDLVARPITLELTPPTLALLRQATRRLEDEAGRALTDDELVTALCASALAGPGDTALSSSGGTAPFQIALTVCASCERGWQDAAGRSYDVPRSMIEQASCDAQHLGRVDGDEAERSWQDVPPATRRMVLRRDRGACTVPGCRSSRWLQVHHIVPQAQGGTHDPSNLTCLCGGHHRALHEGRLTISGSAPDQLIFGPELAGASAEAIEPPPAERPPAEPPSAPPPTPPASLFEDAERALLKLGFGRREVGAALARVPASSASSPDADPGALERVLRAALRELTPSDGRAGGRSPP